MAIGRRSHPFPFPFLFSFPGTLDLQPRLAREEECQRPHVRVRRVRDKKLLRGRLRLVFEQPDDIRGRHGYFVLVLEVVGWGQGKGLREMVSYGLRCTVDGGCEGVQGWECRVDNRGTGKIGLVL